MSASFFQKLGRSYLKGNETSAPSSPNPVSESPTDNNSTPSPVGSGNSTPNRKDVRFKKVTITRQVQRPIDSQAYYQRTGQYDILKRLNKRKKEHVTEEKVPKEKKSRKEKGEKKAKESKKGGKSKSKEFITSEDEESEEDVYEEEEEGNANSDTEMVDAALEKSEDVKSEFVDLKREVLLSSIFTELEQSPKIVHAADIATADTTEYTLPFVESDESPVVELNYPGVQGFGEKFALVAPNKDNYDPIAEIQVIMQMAAKFYFEEADSLAIYTADLQDCVVRRMNRAIKRKALYPVKVAITEYNDTISSLFDDGSRDLYKDLVSQKLKIKKNMTEFTHDILSQIYSRIVSPHVQELRKYTAFSSNVYGELLPKFVSKIFAELEMTSGQIFTDLGSGVGNCVFQAALEIGCESYGCEMMDKAAELGEKQATEFVERLKLWGVQAGAVKLIHGDFVKTGEVSEIMKKTDILLVNNYAFDAELNGNLVHMFLDMKDGAKIVSLKSFVPSGHTITSHNVESPVNMLDVKEQEFFSGSVSWTDAPGKYYISTMDRTRVQKFLDKTDSS
ncbi:histone methylation protein DOT1-domain-containing protein [Lipomyces arxii]|uniref:histone methylation protein DOT1-domain-containing protein n=1 Tax=Lipomyces arxii TaxID=56418 RepID=UPI0034CEAFEC